MAISLDTSVCVFLGQMSFWISEVNELSHKSTISSQLTWVQVLTQLLTHPVHDLHKLANLSELIS